LEAYIHLCLCREERCTAVHTVSRHVLRSFTYLTGLVHFCRDRNICWLR